MNETIPQPVVRASPVPSWERLNKIRQLAIYSFAKWLLIVIPIVASAAQFVQQYGSYKIILPVNLLCLYFSALFFYASCLATELCCPAPIKEHGNFQTFFVFLSSSTDNLADIKQRARTRVDTLLTQLQSALANRTGKAPVTDNTSSLAQDLLTEEASRVFLDEAEAKWREDNEVGQKWVRGIIAAGLLVAALLGLYVTFIDAPTRVIAVSN